jgi:hypothetical protein
MVAHVTNYEMLERMFLVNMEGIFLDEPRKKSCFCIHKYVKSCHSHVIPRLRGRRCFHWDFC